MGAKIIDGKAMSAEIREHIKEETRELKTKGITPGLAVILVGDDPASHVYVNNKEKGCIECGFYSVIHRLAEDTSEGQILELVDELNEDKRIHGILVQLPLPGHIDELKILRRIDPQKDVDGIHIVSAGSLMVGEKGFVACTPLGMIDLIKSTGEEIEGKNAVVIGRSNIVGKPAAMLLLQHDATVTVCHSKTKDLAKIAATADILVAAVGKPEFVTGEMIKPGAIVIDAGTSKVDGKLKGDVVFEEACQIAGYITPVPGGVGPMTITMLLKNTLEGAKMYG